ncbi:hypothetical protein DFH09DRAFT_1286010 [Mycena vulgaris]|nr:hypothetical protein DFH09DRAFT_1286010 [Mycena vulgaris]
MNTPNASFPNEVWMQVFSYLAGGNSLQAVTLTCRRFHNLGMDELLRTLVWKTVEKATNNLKFWEENVELAYIPTSLSLSLAHRDPAACTLPLVLNHVSWFQNLDTLSLSNVILPPVFYHVLLNLPNGKHLNLHSCHVPDAPPKFPFSFPSFWDQDMEDIEIGVTHLSLRNVIRAIQGSIHGDPHTQIDLFKFLPDLEALTLEYVPPVPISILQQLTSLTLLPARSPDQTVYQLNEYLPHTPNLIHLNIGAPRTHTMREAPPPIVPTVPLLETLTGPEFVAHAVLLGSPTLVSLTVNTPLEKTRDALDLIEKCNGPTVVDIELSLTEWDDEVLLAVTQCLPACRSVKVVFRFSEPTDSFLFNLGIEHLSLLVQLHTLHIHARPEDATPPCHDGYSLDEYDDGMGVMFHRRVPAPKETRATAVPPEEEACAEYLAAWTRYNTELRFVRFVRGREWARQGGARWSVECG